MNLLYVGKVRHKEAVFPGEHEAIIPEVLFQRVQKRLRENARTGATEGRNRHGALLRRLLYCKACGRLMLHTFTTRGNTRYRYYTCTNAVKRGRRVCPTASLPAAEIERAVVEQIRGIGDDPELLNETLRQARAQSEAAIERLASERQLVADGAKRCHGELRRLAEKGGAVPARVRLPLAENRGWHLVFYPCCLR